MCSSYAEQGVTQWGKQDGMCREHCAAQQYGQQPLHTARGSAQHLLLPHLLQNAPPTPLPTATAAKASGPGYTKAKHFRSAPAKMAASYPSQTTPHDAEQKQAEIPIYSLTPMCQLLSLHKQQESGKIISCLPPHIVAEPQETDDSVMLSDTWSEHLGKNRQTKKKSSQQKA